MIAWFQNSRLPASVLGLTIDESHLEGVVARRSNGSLEAQKTFAAPLALHPLSADPELLGREIRNHLLNAGIRERRCVVCLPASWALVLQIHLPEIPETDLAGFLEIEAERGFPYPIQTLAISWSICRGAAGPRLATLVAVPRNHLVQLEKALAAARLRPLRFTLALAVMQPNGEAAGQSRLALLVRGNQVDLQIEWGGGIAALRSLDGMIESEQGEKRISAELIAPAIRISLGQLPAEIRQAVKSAEVFGGGQSARDLAERLAQPLATQGISVEAAHRYPPGEFGKRLAPETNVSPGFSAAAKTSLGQKMPIDFFLPKTTSWQQFKGRFSSRKLVWAGASAGAVALLVGGLFLIQQWQLDSLNARWLSIAPKVTELQDLQQQIKKFRPWFDQSFAGLGILRTLAEAFPAEGSVSAKTVEIRDGRTVTCSGVARDNQSLLAMLGKLRAAPQVANLKIDQVRGKSPLQFTFNFQWQEAVHEN